MAKRKKEIEVVEAVAPEVVAPPVVEETPAATVAKVYSRSGQYVRAYSKDEHGAAFQALAQGYAKKIGGSVR